ncbi:hypothetical protein M441DRAFT_53007 [Trichoderma asperellum CBS 433.97]|uniref:Uncharacterized protein n=1 Tax=Trichoderma asperellum (strain ATCC 204424 / CBS 433.97 / NBRC 101777) TaxID=1042311 RepID=A0A2T3ZN73_TRIA4|nr:hypothetical protein M441DRAFT_53007 [Trichoderma asperellum CBS 433.97]PTB46252.1 hypothetical protein M441DRAFT_53007 [Trichoderma asperellum CBS 433.97]
MKLGGAWVTVFNKGYIQSLYATICSYHMSLKFGITLVMRIRQIYNEIGEIIFPGNSETLLVRTY